MPMVNRIYINLVVEATTNICWYFIKLCGVQKSKKPSPCRSILSQIVDFIVQKTGSTIIDFTQLVSLSELLTEYIHPLTFEATNIRWYS